MKNKNIIQTQTGMFKKGLDALRETGDKKLGNKLIQSFSSIKKDDLDNNSQYLDDQQENIQMKLYMHEIYYSKNPQIIATTLYDSYVLTQDLI